MVVVRGDGGGLRGERVIFRRFTEDGREIYHGANNCRGNFPQVWKRKSGSVI